MAGMFYSLQEATEKLNKTEEEINQLVQDGKLREFRDGPNLLFKVEEVEALLSGTDVAPSEEPPESQSIE
jgi:excisionase family DNA binding protein